MPDSARRALAVAAASLILVATLAVKVERVAALHSVMGDFRAFYCSARVMMAGADPYAAQPLARCEMEPAPLPLFTAKPDVVLPAPLPGYLIAAFTPFALLPFAVASAAWALLLLAATAAAVFLLWRLRLGSPLTLLVALAMPVFAISVVAGEIPPIALLGVALAAWGADRNRPAAVGLGILLALAEPQLGLACALAALALSRRLVVPVLTALGATLALSLLALGVKGNVEYLATVLPLHIAAELPSVQQYSLSWVLNRLTVPDAAAILLGRLSYVAMLGLGIWFARSRTAREAPAAAILAAPAFAVVGGPFVHLDHIALALPAALWLSSRRVPASIPQLVAVIALAVPLLFVLTAPTMILMVPFVAGWIGSASGRGMTMGLRAAAAATVAVALVAFVIDKTGTGVQPMLTQPAVASRLAQESWGELIRRTNVMTAWSIWLVKLPTWYGVVVTAAYCVLSNYRRGRAASSG